MRPLPWGKAHTIAEKIGFKQESLRKILLEISQAAPFPLDNSEISVLLSIPSRWRNRGIRLH